MIPGDSAIFNRCNRLVYKRTSVREVLFRVRLVRPEGFVEAKRFSGFQQDETGASVLVMEIPGPFAAAAAAFTADSLASQGIVLKQKKEVTIAGRSGLLLAVTQTVQGLKFNKWIAVFGDETNAVIITASIPSEHSKRLSTILRDCVLHAEYGAQD